MKGVIMHWLAVAAVIYLGILLGVFALQRSLLYPASKEVPRLSEAWAPGFRAVTTEPEEGVKLTHWYREPADAEGPVVVIFHGNAGHIGDRVPKYAPLYEAGFGIFLVGYRGYGGNPGRPSEDGLSADARSVLDWLSGSGLTPGRLVLYGESLGTAVAVKMASEREAAAVVLEAPPSSIAEVAQAHYWYLPARWLVLDKWDSLSRIAEISAPLLIFHGGRDRVVPQRFGRKLFAAAAEPKQAIFLPEGQHTDLLDFPQVATEVVAFIRAQTGG
jgi:fermentation-respiration switch protein FrsA (DUF1100 family)